MDIQQLARIRKKVDGKLSKEEALATVHKTPEELQQMASDYSENVGYAGGTIAKIGGPIGTEITNVATHLESSSLPSLLRRLGNSKASELAKEFVNKDIPLKEKSEGIERMRQAILKKLK